MRLVVRLVQCPTVDAAITLTEEQELRWTGDEMQFVTVRVTCSRSKECCMSRDDLDCAAQVLETVRDSAPAIRAACSYRA